MKSLFLEKSSCLMRTGAGTNQSFITVCQYFFKKCTSVLNYQYESKFYLLLACFLLSFC